MSQEPLGKNARVRELLRLSEQIEQGKYPPEFLGKLRILANEILFQIQRKVMSHERPNDTANLRMASLRGRSDGERTSSQSD